MRYSGGTKAAAREGKLDWESHWLNIMPLVASNVPPADWDGVRVWGIAAQPLCRNKTTRRHSALLAMLWY
jgi:hypothetical protein